MEQIITAHHVRIHTTVLFVYLQACTAKNYHSNSNRPNDTVMKTEYSHRTLTMKDSSFLDIISCIRGRLSNAKTNTALYKASHYKRFFRFLYFISYTIHKSSNHRSVTSFIRSFHCSIILSDENFSKSNFALSENRFRRSLFSINWQILSAMISVS